MGRPECLHLLPSGKVTGADVAHLAGAHQIIQGAQTLINRDGGVRGVELVEVKVVCAQAAEAGVALFQDLVATHAKGKLGGENHARPLAIGLQRFAQNFLTGPAPIAAGCVDKVETGGQRLVDHAQRVLFRRPLPKLPGAQTKCADLKAGAAQRAVVHQTFPFLVV